MSNSSNDKLSIKAVLIILAALLLLTFAIDRVLFASTRATSKGCGYDGEPYNSDEERRLDLIQHGQHEVIMLQKQIST
jgi:hypothetical protein